MVTKAEFLFMIQSVNLLPSVHTITSSAHCSTLQPSATCSQPSSAHTAAVITSSVHTAANLQCTLQLYYLVPILYITSSAPPQGKPIPLLAYLQSSQQTLMVVYNSPNDEEDWLIVAVQDVSEEMKKMNNYSMNF